tara:strand:+ start:3440 stop:3874 length:435 start_codon:yes stop_codon:yes gene_type:complete
MDYKDLIKTTKDRVRVGRGKAGRRGKTAGRGMKGTKSRSGGKLPTMFDGGSLPYYRKARSLGGFINRNSVVYQVVNIADLDKTFDDGKKLTVKHLLKKGLVRKGSKVKLLGNGKTKKKFEITVDAASKSAIHKLEKSGGKVSIK